MIMKKAKADMELLDTGLQKIKKGEPSKVAPEPEAEQPVVSSVRFPALARILSKNR